MVAFEFIRAALRRAGLHGVQLYVSSEWTRERLLNNRAYDGAMRLVSDSLSAFELSYALQQHENVVRVEQLSWAQNTPRIVQLHVNLFGCHITFGQRARSKRGGEGGGVADGADMQAPPVDESALQRVDDFRSRHSAGLNAHMSDPFGRLQSPEPVNIALDAQQAWFTVNALYFCINTGVVHDPTQKGLKDLSARVLRHISQPDGTLVSKSQRWPLEVVCSATELGFTVAPETWEVLRQLGQREHEQVAWAKRATVHLTRALSVPNFARVTSSVHTLGLRDLVFPTDMTATWAAGQRLQLFCKLWTNEAWEEGLCRVAFLQAAYPRGVVYSDDDLKLANPPSTTLISELAKLSAEPAALPLFALLSPIATCARYDADTWNSVSDAPATVDAVTTARQVQHHRLFPLHMRGVSRYLRNVLGTPQAVSDEVMRLEAAMLRMPHIPPIGHAMYENPNWPELAVKSQPLLWGAWLREAGSRWRMAVATVVPLRQAAHLQPFNVESVTSEEVTRCHSDPEPSELAQRSRVMADELCAWMESSGFAAAALAPALVVGAELRPLVRITSNRGQAGRVVATTTATAALWSVVNWLAQRPASDAEDADACWQWLQPLLHDDVLTDLSASALSLMQEASRSSEQ